MKKIILVSIVLLSSFYCYSQNFSLVRDINRGFQERQPVSLTASNGLLYFIERNTYLAGYPSDQGNEVWKTDGTEAGTIQLGVFDGVITDLLDTDSGIYFVVRKSGVGIELWKTNGTIPGTLFVKSIPADLNARPVSIGNTVYFASDNELWESDGTETGTALVFDIDEPIMRLATAGNLVYIVTSAPLSDDRKLWRSDGTDVGTFAINTNFKNVNGVTEIENFCDFNGDLYFSANEGINGTELWKSNGTIAGTVMVKDITPGSNGSYLSSLTPFSGKLYFSYSDGLESAIWTTDGTESGTSEFRKFTTGAGQFTVVNETLYFTASEAGTGTEIWKSDGTSGGTSMIKDIYPGPEGSGPLHLRGSDNLLFFLADNGSVGYELWKSDGTTEGTSLVKDIYTGKGSCGFSATAMNGAGGGLSFERSEVLNNNYYFVATNGINGTELWTSDGTATGTKMVIDISKPTPGSDPTGLTRIGNEVFFNAYDPYASPGTSFANEPFRTDGTLSGTVMFANINRMGGSNPSNFFKINQTLFFSANNSDNGTELWKFEDGVDNLPVMVKNINGGASFFDLKSSFPDNFVALNAELIFTADDDITGTELWKSDATEIGTVMIKDINPGSDGSNPSNLININGTIYFTADDGTNGRELWKSDGTETGTVLVKNINSSGSSDAGNLVQVGNMFFFTASDGANGMELWKSDGTDAGTVMVKNINPAGDSNPQWLTNVNGTLYFSADDGVHGEELWKSDGTANGTVMVTDIVTGPAGSSPSELKPINNILFFTADDAARGRELWSTDGIEANTKLVRDIQTGSGSSNPSVLTRVGNNLVFAADDGVHGREAWISNGTGASTRLMFDIEPGPDSSDPTEIIEVNGRILVSAFTSYFGRELWVGDAPAESPLPLDLLEFKGSIVNEQGYLQWKTENESGTAIFIVERSADGQTYKPIGSVNAMNTAGIHHYDYTDTEFSSLQATPVYYRLKQVDLNGQYSYSNVVTLIPGKQQLMVRMYPNPVRDKINLQINMQQATRLQWQLTDLSGKTIRSGFISVLQGTATFELGVPGIGNGIYYLQLSGRDIRQVFKVLKQ